jgi:hypothetical protein
VGLILEVKLGFLLGLELRRARIGCGADVGGVSGVVLKIGQ